MFLLQAPWPLLKTTCLLPSPEEGNTRSLAATVQPQRATDGTLRTYIKPKRGRRAHQWDFVVSGDKAAEVKEFVRRYGGSVVLATDHNGVAYKGNLTLNPQELSGQGRAGGWPGGEAYRTSIRLEEMV